MGMLSRMSDIVQANINALLDKAEDPAKVIKLIIQEMEEALSEARCVAARHIAEQKHLQRQIDGLHKEAASWQKKAQLAVAKDQEPLARAALLEKQGAVRKAEELSQEYQVIQQSLHTLQQDTARLQQKLAEAKNKQKSLETRKRFATVRLTAQTSENVAKLDEAIARFEHYERRIDNVEAEVEAFALVEHSNTLHQQFHELESLENIDKELQAIKHKVA